MTLFYPWYILLSFLFPVQSKQSFKASQLKYSRVKSAYEEKQERLEKLFKVQGLDLHQSNIFIRIFKSEGQLELWASANKTNYKLINQYKICAFSGKLGPKRKRGDLQTPEGFYFINRFNPQSNYHLSLGLNYPNDADKLLGNKKNLGGDIFIHGDCVTIGCVPLTDELIEEVYISAVEAFDFGQTKIPVHIFPMKLNKEGLSFLKREYAHELQLIKFWNNLSTAFDYFENNKLIPQINVNVSGKYLINN